MDLPKSSLVAIVCLASKLSFLKISHLAQDPGFNKTQAGGPARRQDHSGQEVDAQQDVSLRYSRLSKLGLLCQLRWDRVSKGHGMCWPGKPGEDSWGSLQ